MYRHLTPVPRLEDLTSENTQALAQFRAAMNVSEDVDLTGEWWGVIVFEPRRFQRCDTQQDAERAGLALGRDLSADVWLQDKGHPSARLLASFR